MFHLYTPRLHLHCHPYNFSPGAIYGSICRASILLKLSPQLGSRTGIRAVGKVEDCINISSHSSIHHSIRSSHPPSTVYPHAMGAPHPQSNISRGEEQIDGKTYTPQRSPPLRLRWPPGKSRAQRTRRSGAWVPRTPWPLCTLFVRQRPFISRIALYTAPIPASIQSHRHGTLITG